jgi:DNA-binding transcriptional LysR family regulator
MELRHLRYFLAVADELNFSRAAERLHVSQPPLSRQIQDLESELKLKLFSRNRCEVSLTPAGKKLLPYAKKVVTAVESLLENAKCLEANHDEEQIHIGCTPLGTAQIISSTLAYFQTASSHTRAVLHDLNRSEMLCALRTKKLNVAVTQRPATSETRGLSFQTICQYPAGIICPKIHPIAQQPEICQLEISKFKLVVYSTAEFPEYHKWIAKILGIPRKDLTISQECNDILSLIGCVETGYGVAIVSQAITSVIGDHIKFVPFGPATKFLEVGLLYRKNEYNEDVKKLMTAGLTSKLQINDDVKQTESVSPAPQGRNNGYKMPNNRIVHLPSCEPAKLLANKT